MSPELGGGWSPKNAEGVQGLSWKNTEMLLGWKTGRPLTSTAFHPQTDGATERANRLIPQILQTVVTNDQKDWSSKCLMVEFAINSSINATTGYAPFKLNYGYML